MNANTALSEPDRQEIEEAIGRAEANTAAEIVCAVATQSGWYERAEAIVGLVFALLALALAHAFYSWLTIDPGSWATGALGLGGQAAAVVFGFVIGNVLATRVMWLRRPFIFASEIEHRVRRAAAYVFAIDSVGDTDSNTGLLIYCSLFERRIVILADRSTREALGDEGIAHLRDLAVDDLKRGEFKKAFIDVIEAAAPKLAEALPADRDVNPNELANHVRLYHPRPSASE
ncbi:MAG: hypothetical protein EA377_12690 [Phycisphaerales bacterium]|nr:MAG: hypothetical protein EA377_12690 [Phycisphaerales bacterium]